MEVHYVYSTDPDWLSKIFTPAYFIAFGITLFLNYVCCPVLFTFFVPLSKRKKLGSKKVYLYSLLASTVHAMESFTFAGYVLMTGELGISTTFSNSPLGYMVLQLTLGYATVDGCICLLDLEQFTYSTLLHHIAIVTGITMGFYHNAFMFFIVYRLMAEFSTPWVNLRWIVYNLGDKTGKLYVFVSLGMTFTFFLSRIAVIPWHTYKLYTALLYFDGPLLPMHLRVYMILNFGFFDALNLFWFYKIVRGAYKLLFAKKTTHSD